MNVKKLKTQYNYDRIGEFCEGLAIIWLNEKYGFIDLDGKEIIPPIYDYAADFHQGTATVKFRTQWRTIDKNGTILAKRDEIKPVLADESDESDNKTVQTQEPEPEIIINNCVQFKSKRKFGLKDMDGNEVIAPKYNAFKEFSKNLIQIKANRKWGLADMSGNEIIAPKYDEIRSLVNGYAQVRLDNKWGLIDESGSETVEPKFYNPSSLYKSVFGGFKDKSGNKQQFEWD
jgi:hypothetical protein